MIAISCISSAVKTPQRPLWARAEQKLKINFFCPRLCLSERSYFHNPLSTVRSNSDVSLNIISFYDQFTTLLSSSGIYVSTWIAMFQTPPTFQPTQCHIPSFEGSEHLSDHLWKLGSFIIIQPMSGGFLLISGFLMINISFEGRRPLLQFPS